jgi:hypothetical protein
MFDIRKDDWLVLAVVIAVISPVLPFVGNPTNLAAVVMLIALVHSGNKGLLLGLVYMMCLVLLLASASTVTGFFAVESSYTINPNAFGPFFRIAICFFALRAADDVASIQRKLLWVGFFASAFAVLQYFSLSAAEFTSKYYLAPERSAVFTEDFSGDAFVRVIGFYENPSSVALLSIALILVSLDAFSKGSFGRITLVLFVLMHVAAGLLSLSKIFFAGLPLVLLQLVALRFRKAALLAIVLSCLVVALVYAFYESTLLDVIRYAFSATLDPDLALKGRYLPEQEEVISRSWLSGYGLINLDNVNINDSAYLVTLYLLGFFGGLVLMMHILWWLWTGRRLPLTLYLLLVLILIAGVGANSILGFRVDIYLTALCALLCRNSIAERVKKLC